MIIKVNVRERGTVEKYKKEGTSKLRYVHLGKTKHRLL